jgi:hypothetical protein
VDLSGDLVGQHLTFVSLECVKRRPRDLLGRTLRRVEIAGEVRVDEAGMQRDDLGALFRKLDAKAVVSAHSADFDAP